MQTINGITCKAIVIKAQQCHEQKAARKESLKERWQKN
jgi:hypothetical protein